MIYDPVGIAALWKSEIDNGEVQVTMRDMGQLGEETGCAMIPVHHVRKPPMRTANGIVHLDFGQEARGGGAIFAGCAGYSACNPWTRWAPVLSCQPSSPRGTTGAGG